MAARKTSLLPLSFPIALALIFLVLAQNAVAAAAAPEFEGLELQYYVQILLGDVDVATNFLPPLNPNVTAGMGTGELFAFNVTKGPKRTSKLLGHARGFTFETSPTATAMETIEVELIQYDDGYYKGTIQIQGLIEAIQTNEVAIVGGTGSFRGAKGYGLISRLLLDGNYRLFHHELHFL